MLIMVSGSVRLRVDDKEFEATAGDMIFFPTGSHHAAVGTGPDGCVYYELFAPAHPN